MKYEWKKHEKELYVAKQKPVFIEIPKQSYIMINGKGNPNEEDFSNRISALFSLAYGIKMLFKKSSDLNVHQEFEDFTVFPLESVWDKGDTHELDKNELTYTLMIKQHDFISEEFYRLALESVKRKKPNPLYEEITFREMDSEKAIQILHVGSYDNEPQSFSKMDAFAQELDLKRTSKVHREIYLSNKNRTAEEKQKTILRYSVQ